MIQIKDESHVLIFSSASDLVLTMFIVEPDEEDEEQTMNNNWILVRIRSLKEENIKSKS